jgi:hypothetical protein
VTVWTGGTAMQSRQESGIDFVLAIFRRFHFLSVTKD